MTMKKLEDAVPAIIALLQARNFAFDADDLSDALLETLQGVLTPEEAPSADIDVDLALASGDTKAMLRTLKVQLAVLDIGLGFALCNYEHSGTRRDIKKAQPYAENAVKLVKALLEKEGVDA